VANPGLAGSGERSAESRPNPGPGPLSGNRDFLKLWAGQGISAFGSLITRTALPWAAIIALQAGPLEMGLVSAAELAPGLLAGPFAGVWADRLRRRPLLIAADLGRALLLGSIPVAALLHRLGMAQIYVVAFLAGMLTLLFDVAHASYLPSLVRREELVEANSRIRASSAIAEVSAFGSAGWLVQWLTPPFAILIDAVSFVVSGAFLVAIRSPEPAPPRTAHEPHFGRELREGLRALVHDPLLASITVGESLFALSFGIGGAVYMLFVTRDLGLKTGLLGLLFAVGGVSSALGARAASPVAGRLGLGRTLVAGLLVNGLTRLLLPLAHGATALSALLIAVQQSGDGAATIYLINQSSLVQVVTPDRLRGRVNAGIRVATITTMLLGALAGGLLGEAIGTQRTLIVSAALAFVAALVLWRSPVGRLRKMPAGSPG
jgi:MFS family permease